MVSKSHSKRERVTDRPTRLLVDPLHLSPRLALVVIPIDGARAIGVHGEHVVAVVLAGLKVDGPVDELEKGASQRGMRALRERGQRTHVEVEVVNSEILKGLVEALLDTAVLVCVPDPDVHVILLSASEGNDGTWANSLGGDEDLLARDTGGADTLSDLLLVAVDGSGIDVAVSHLQGVLDGLSDLAGGGLLLRGDRQQERSARGERATSKTHPSAKSDLNEKEL